MNFPSDAAAEDDATQPTPKTIDKHASQYWSQSLRTVVGILSVWASISLGCGVLFREWLDATLPNVGGAPFGFWMAQQGSIIGFLILLFVYMFIMNRIDRQHGYGAGDES